MWACGYGVGGSNDDNTHTQGDDDDDMTHAPCGGNVDNDNTHSPLPPIVRTKASSDDHAVTGTYTP